MKRKDIVESKFLISVNCYDQITVGTYLYGCVSLLAQECTVCLCMFVCVCVCVCVRSNKSSGKKPHYVSDLSKLIVCTSPPFLLGGSVSYQIFKKGGGGLTGSQFLEGGDFFQGVAVFTTKKIDMKYLTTKKSLWTKMFFSQLRI